MRWLIIALAAALQALPASAQKGGQAPPPAPGPRTYVSGSGSDAAACSVTSPCRTLQAAINLTTPGGAVTVLNSAFYGAVTINKALSIDAAGAVASVSAIAIAAGPADAVTLSGLEVDAQRAGAIGIAFSSGNSLTLTRSSVRNATDTGIVLAAGQAFLGDVMLAGNGNNGLEVRANASAVASRTTAAFNATGFYVNGGRLIVTEAIMLGGNYGIAAAGGSAFVRNTIAASSAIGLRADGAAVSIVGSRIDGLVATNGGTIVSFGNNSFTNGAPTSSTPLSYLLDDKGGYLLDDRGGRLIAG